MGIDEILAPAQVVHGLRAIGKTGGSAVRIAVDGVTAIDIPVPEAERVWSTAIESRMAKRAAAGAA